AGEEQRLCQRDGSRRIKHLLPEKHATPVARRRRGFALRKTSRLISRQIAPSQLGDSSSGLRASIDWLVTASLEVAHGIRVRVRHALAESADLCAKSYDAASPCEKLLA